MPKAPKTPKVPKVPEPQVPAVTVSTPEVAVTTTDITTPTTQPASLLPKRAQNVSILGLATICFTIATGLITTGQYIPGIGIGTLGVAAFYVYERYG